MIVELLSLILFATPLEQGAEPFTGAARLAAAGVPAELSPAFMPDTRAVSNWRFEAARHLDAPAAALAKHLSGEAAATPRCVKLNNYWCVKRAGWSGEIAADAEGHVAFSSAAEGAAVAALLLRRYYLVYNLRTAQAILARWAPAQCGLAAGAARRGAPKALSAIAPRGIGGTLRARWLASHRPGGAPRRPVSGDAASAGKTAKGKIVASKTIAGKAVADKAPGDTAAASEKPAATKPAPCVRMSIVIDRRTRMIAAPEIAVGMGERAAAGPSRPVTLASLDVLGTGARLAPLPPPAPSCAEDATRLRNYALRAVEGLDVDPNEDLELFMPDGSAGPRLAPMLRNMARVEIGPLGVGDEAIAAAVAAIETRREAERTPPQPPIRPAVLEGRL